MTRVQISKSAVSRVSNGFQPADVSPPPKPRNRGRSADWKSAIQHGGAATQTQTRLSNASRKEAQNAQKGILLLALVPFCGQENLVGLKRADASAATWPGCPPLAYLLNSMTMPLVCFKERPS